MLAGTTATEAPRCTHPAGPGRSAGLAGRSVSDLVQFDLTAVPSDAVLARVVLLLNAKGARLVRLTWAVQPGGTAAGSFLVSAAPGRVAHLTQALRRLVEVIAVEASTPPVTIRESGSRPLHLSAPAIGDPDDPHR